MRVLLITTKCPWPAIDGGRLATLRTLEALRQAGADVHVIAPVRDGDINRAGDDGNAASATTLVDSAPRAWPRAALDALLSRQAVTTMRHAHPALRPAIDACVERFRPDLVVAEPLQALAMLGPPPWPRPVVLRLQNVESALWANWPAPALLRPWLRVEGRRVRAAESAAIHAADLSLAITAVDATDLASIAGPQARLVSWDVPFHAELPAGASPPGAARIVLAASAGWGPNREAMAWAQAELANALATRAPALRLTMYAAQCPSDLPGNVQWARPPASAVDLFPAGAIAAVPLFTGSGVRMRILEAWARGLPVVATRVAARGLGVQDGQELLIADSAADFADALARLADDDDLRAKLVAGGRAYLRQYHDPDRLAAVLATHCATAIATHARRSAGSA
jgi:hypothetical protein